MDSMSFSGKGWDFNSLSELYEEVFKKEISGEEFLKILTEIFDEEKEDRKERKKRDYDEEEDESETEEYVEVFRRKVIDYLLATRLEKEGKETINSEHAFPDRTNHKNEIAYSEKMKQDVTNLKYENPVFFNNQWTYQRIFIENSGGEESVYALTMKASSMTGMGVEIKYDEKFNTGYVTSIDGRMDGEADNETGRRRYWEYWLIDKETGEERIGETGIHEQRVRKNEAVEWRLATEQESGCGGGVSYDPLVLQNDPTVNKSNLPSFIQNSMSMHFYGSVFHRTRNYARAL